MDVENDGSRNYSGVEDNSRLHCASEDAKNFASPKTPEHATLEFYLKNIDDHSIRQLVFTSKEEAHDFYLEYGRLKGHDVRKTSSKARYLEMECSGAITQEGRKCKCPARLRVAFPNYSNRFHVTDFNSHHNHELATDDTAHLLKVNRYISEADRTLLRLCRESGFPTYKSVDFLESVRGKELPYTKKDVHNLVYRDKEKDVAMGDAQKALGFLEGLKCSDPGMICKHEVAEDKTLSRLLWADGFGRDAYRAFGDVLVFDSTYKTNKYNIPLVIFSGVDNHLKNCVFGAALLIDETIESYEWALQTFLDVMGGKSPKSVLTDQDASMDAAILKVFPKAKHRLCSWHLERNCNKNVKRYGFCSDFGTLLKENLSIEEFEQKWGNLIEKYDVSANRWIVETYGKKEKWAEAFFRGQFMGLMRSTQRAESLNAVFKHEVKSGFNITELLQHFHIVVSRMRSSFLKLQQESDLNKPRLKQLVIYNLLKHASQVYTKEVFNLVQIEWLEVGGLVVDSEYIRGKRQFYYSFLNCNNKEGKHWSVEIDLDRDKYLCDCKKLESDGLPCRHIVYFWKNNFFNEIPQSVICDRWTTEIGNDLRTKFVTIFPKEDPKRMRFGDVFQDAVNVCNRSEDSETKKAVAKRGLMDILMKFDEIDRLVLPVEQKSEKPEDLDDTIKPSGTSSVRDPEKVNTRGAPAATQQKCGTCSTFGHKKPGCPLNNPNKISEKQTKTTGKRQKMTETTGKRMKSNSLLDREGSNEIDDEIDRAGL